MTGQIKLDHNALDANTTADNNTAVGYLDANTLEMKTVLEDYALHLIRQEVMTNCYGSWC